MAGLVKLMIAGHSGIAFSALTMFASSSRIGNMYSTRFMNLVKYASSVPSKSYGTLAISSTPVTVGDKAAVARGKKISQAMRSYLERSKAHTTFMETEIAEYEVGKRHLANIMGEDPDTFSQDDIDRAIQYLMPSGLFDKKARPELRHPAEVIPVRKAAQFDVDGRPFHSMYYTGKPNLFELFQQAGVKVEELQQFEDTQLSIGLKPATSFRLGLAGSVWVLREQLEILVQEKVSDSEYVRFIKLMERLMSQPYAAKETDFIGRFRKAFSTQSMLQEIPPLQYDSTGRGFMDATGRRKAATAEVRVWEKGSGQITINGVTLLEKFSNIADRQQILFPLQFCDVVDMVDVMATVSQQELTNHHCNMERKVWSAHAGATRLGIARALQSMVSVELSEKMRLAGLLTIDPRTRERKKPGQEGSRRKFTWKKR